jgi:hypothetical protein
MNIRSYLFSVLAFILISACSTGSNDSGDDTATNLQDSDTAREVIIYSYEEAAVQSSLPDENLEGGPLVVVNYVTGNARSYIKFDMTGVPAAIKSARLELYYCNCDGIAPIAVHPAAGEWTAGEITWNNQPGAYNDSQPLDVVNLSSDPYDCGDCGQYVAMPGGKASKEGWIITDLVRGWTSGSVQNCGVVLISSPEQPVPYPPGRLMAFFGHSENTGSCPSNPPRLRITY